jgi:hypothetical protein
MREPIIRQQPVVEDRTIATSSPPAYHQEHVIVTAAAAERQVTTHRRFDPARTLTVLAGIVLIVIGAVAVARAGLSGPLDQPVVEVAGITHTALLGLIEVAIGLLTVLAGVSGDRGTILFATIAFGVAALVAAIEPDIGGGALALERSWAVVLVIGFATLAIVAALAPTMMRSTTRVEQI